LIAVAGHAASLGEVAKRFGEAVLAAQLMQGCETTHSSQSLIYVLAEVWEWPANVELPVGYHHRYYFENHSEGLIEHEHRVIPLSGLTPRTWWTLCVCVCLCVYV